ncbi:unnamed protein product [Ectocarpus fasciculatus]
MLSPSQPDPGTASGDSVSRTGLAVPEGALGVEPPTPMLAQGPPPLLVRSKDGDHAAAGVYPSALPSAHAPGGDLESALLDSRAAVAATAATGTAPPMIDVTAPPMTDVTAAPIAQSSSSPGPASTMLDKAFAGAAAESTSSAVPLHVSHGHPPPGTAAPVVQTAPTSSTAASAESVVARNVTPPALPLSHGMLPSDESQGSPSRASGREGFTAPPATNCEPQAPPVVQGLSVQGRNSPVSDTTSGTSAAGADPSAGTPAAEAEFPAGPSSDVDTASEEPKTAAAAGIASASAVTDTCSLACPTSPVLLPSPSTTLKTEAAGITLPTQLAARGSSQACSTSPVTGTKSPRVATAGAAPTKEGVAPELPAVQGACPVSVSSLGAPTTAVAASATSVPPTSTMSAASPPVHDSPPRRPVQPDSATSPATPAADTVLAEKTASPSEPATHTDKPMTPAGGAETFAARSRTQAVSAASLDTTEAAATALSEEPESPLEPGEIRLDSALVAGSTAKIASGGETQRAKSVSPGKAVGLTTDFPAGPLSSSEPAKNSTKMTMMAGRGELIVAGSQTQAAVAKSLGTVKAVKTAPSEGSHSLSEPAERSAESTLRGGLTESVAPGAESHGADSVSSGTTAAPATAPGENASPETAKHVDKIVTPMVRRERIDTGSQGDAGAMSLDTEGAAAKAPSEESLSPSEPTERSAESTTTGLTESTAPAGGTDRADAMSPGTVVVTATAIREKSSSRAEPVKHVDQTTSPVKGGELIAAGSQARDASATPLSTTEAAATALEDAPASPEPAERLAASTSATGLTEGVAPADNLPRADAVSPGTAAADATALREDKPSPAEPTKHVDQTTTPVGGGAHRADDARATSAGAAEAVAIELPKGVPPPTEPAKTTAASTLAAGLAESFAPGGDIQSADAVAPISSAASATVFSVGKLPAEPAKKCSKATATAEGGKRTTVDHETTTDATGTSAMAAASATGFPAGTPISSEPATTCAQTAVTAAAATAVAGGDECVAPGGKTTATVAGTSAAIGAASATVSSAGTPSSLSEPKPTKASTNKTTTAEGVDERIAPGDETQRAGIISSAAAVASSAACSEEAPFSSEPPIAGGKTTAAAGVVETIAPRMPANTKTTGASALSPPTCAATVTSEESPHISESAPVEVVENSSSDGQTEPGAVASEINSSSTDVLHRTEPTTERAKATTGAPVMKNRTSISETEIPVTAPLGVVAAAAAAAPSEETLTSCEPAKKSAKTATASGVVKAVASRIDTPNAAAKAPDAGVVTTASSQEFLSPPERVEIRARKAAADGTDRVRSASETQTAATTDSQGVDATPCSSVSSSLLAGGDQVAEAATGANSQASANANAGLQRGPGGGKKISVGPAPAADANASSSAAAKGGGGGGKKKKKRRDFSTPPPPRSKPRRGQSESPGPAHSVEEYLANTKKGTEAVASITEGTVFWIKFSDTKEVWVECAVVTKVYPRSVKPFEVTWRPFDSGGCNLALNAQKRITLTPRLFVSSPADPEPAGENDPPAGTARQGEFQPARKKFKLTVPPIGSWCIVKPDQPWGQLDPFTYE